jgi:mannitol/fructose-specific phosphotransferase system IIA component (Ntr-type)
MSDAAQQEKSHIIIPSLTTKDQAEPYLHFITTIAGVLQQPDKRDILLHATTAKEAAAVFH